jgi:DNA-binding transcriptional LysR family regulator
MALQSTKHLRSIGIFVCAAEAGSFSKAALDLGVTPQAISSQIKILEESVRARLFHRNTRKMKLTDEGVRFYERCRNGVASIEDGIKDLHEAEEDIAGTVRIAVPHFMSRTAIVPLLKTFLDKNPGAAVEVIAQHEYPDFVDQGIDIAFLSRQKPRNSFIARRICFMRHVLCAAPDYLRKHGVPQSPEDLHNFRCILIRHPQTGKIMPWEFQRARGKVMTLKPRSSLTTNDVDTQRQAVLGGLGIGQMANFYAAQLVRSGRLIEIDVGYLVNNRPLYICTARRTKMPKRTRILVDLLYQGLKQHPDFLF